MRGDLIYGEIYNDMNYDTLFNGHLVVVTGIFRSGTSILHRIVGSMKNCYSLYEPLVFPLVLEQIHNGYISEEHGKQLLQRVLFEDMYLNIIQGRYINFREHDHSYIGNYEPIDDVKNRWKSMGRRKDVMDFLNDNDYMFVLKSPNIYPFVNIIRNVFKDVRFIASTRDMVDNIESITRKRFWTTNVANMYRCMKEYELEHYGDDDFLFYDLNEMINDPHGVCEGICKFLGSRNTSITDNNISDVMIFKKERKL